MAGENIPSRNADYGPWITVFASVATANVTALNLTSGQATTLTAAASAFETARANAIAAKASAEGATATQRNMRTYSEGLFRPTAKVIAANPNISDELKAELGLSVVPSVSGPVNPATELAVDGLSNGENQLKWKRNGNAKTTVFRIEAKVGDSSVWTFVANTNRVSHVHSGQTPGLQMTYRVISQRGEVQSGPSNEAVVYSTSGGEVVNLKLAA